MLIPSVNALATLLELLSMIFLPTRTHTDTKALLYPGCTCMHTQFKKICRRVVLCYHPYLVFLPFAVPLSLHVVTLLMLYGQLHDAKQQREETTER